MTYASAARRPNPAAMAGALGLPGAMAALLVVGLAVKVATTTDVPRPKGEMIIETPLTPPPPPKPDQPQPRDTATTTTIIDTVPPSLPSLPESDFTLGDPIPAFPGAGSTIGSGAGPIDLGIPGPSPSASPFDPVGAAPRNNPARWITNADYRSRWIQEELSGSARFTLAIDASGKVTGCKITRSTGHTALDAATCDLVTKRARFDAARDGTGKAVPGSYKGAITWKIPE